MIPLRDENPTHRTPWVTYLLFGANLAVFAFQLQVRVAGGDEAYVALVTRLGLIPAALTSPSQWIQMPIPAPLTLLTSMFVHGDLFHLGGNMLYLWVFADNVEDTLGSARFLAFYLLCGLSAAGAQVALVPQSDVPMVGASGAIAGVLGAYMLLYPAARVLTLVFLVIFIRVMYLPSVILLGFWFLIQIWSASGTGTAGVAWYAHIGGFVAGVLLVKAFANPTRRRLPRVETYRYRP
ncbi:MAG TPA: rhomboid family intramembrane serine protease [Acidobacteriota bacterium]|nr:rhomboid family intramembrane serine protease [Acidobacteriota bacterium]